MRPRCVPSIRPTFPSCCAQLGASLLVTTYQAGKLVMVPRRRGQPQHPLPRLPGSDGPRSRRQPAGRRHGDPGLGVCRRPRRDRQAGPAGQARCLLPSPGQPRHGQHPGPRDSLGPGGELWVVNTRFSCLCTLDRSASFTPRWRPPFVTALEPTDRCHLNGLAMVDGRPRYVTALGETDEPGRLAGGQGSGRDPDGRGQRRGHHAGAFDAPLAALVRRAGSGSASRAPGRWGSSTRAPGATSRSPRYPASRAGSDFAGNLAFVGLSQVRESGRLQRHPDHRAAQGRGADLRGLRGRSVRRAGRRFCGSRTAVQEIFAVTVLPEGAGRS